MFFTGWDFVKIFICIFLLVFGRFLVNLRLFKDSNKSYMKFGRLEVIVYVLKFFRIYFISIFCNMDYFKVN